MMFKDIDVLAMFHEWKVPGASWVLICRINSVLICDELSSLKGMQTRRYPIPVPRHRSASHRLA